MWEIESAKTVCGRGRWVAKAIVVCRGMPVAATASARERRRMRRLKEKTATLTMAMTMRKGWVTSERASATWPR